MGTERKQVLGVGDTVDELTPVASAPTQPIGGTLHGDIANLTQTGANFDDAPLNTIPPYITGTAQEGETLSVDTGTWASQRPITEYTYQWKADGTNITDATDVTLVLTSSEVDAVITCEVTATSASGSTAELSNETSAVIAAG